MHLLFNKSRINFSRQKAATVQFESRGRRVKITEGDFFTVLNNEGYEGVHFIGKGNVSNVKEESEERINPYLNNVIEPYFKYTITGDSFEDFKSYSELDDFTYSLKKIYRYERPWMHFRSAFTRLDTEDVVTLEKEWIYISRTVFGRLLNSLPRINKLDFVSNIITHYDTNDLTNVDYIEGLRHLQDYIDEKIFTKGRFIQASRNILNQNFRQIISNVNEIGFVLDGKQEESISDQARLFDRVFELQEVFTNVRQNLENTAEKNKESLEHFGKVFRNNVWPIDLNRNE